MTTQEAVDIFKILQDKYASPHLIDSEIVRMLNMAQYERLNRLIPDDMGGVVNFEMDQNVALNVKPLIYNLTGLSAESPSTLVLDSTINAALVTALDDIGITEPDAKYFRIANVVREGDDIVYCKYTKHNNYNRISANSFKAPTAGKPAYSLLANGIQIYPQSASMALYTFGTTVVKHPRKMDIEPNPVDPEWDDYNMNLIIMIALQLAGISTRDEELIADIRNVKVTN